MVVCQGEIPPDGIAEAARGAKRFVFNLAPVVDVDPEVIRMADPLVVNEHEAALVALALGSTTSRLEDDPDAALRELLNLGAAVLSSPWDRQDASSAGRKGSTPWLRRP